MEKSSIGVYCDKAIYSILITDNSKLEILKVEKHEGRLRHFKFINYIKKLADAHLYVIYENEEAKPIINYLKREGKRDYLAIDFSPLPNHPNYRENPDLPTLVRKLSHRRKTDEVVFPNDQVEIKKNIEALGDGDKPVHMRSCTGFVLALMAAAHGIFSLEN